MHAAACTASSPRLGAPLGPSRSLRRAAQRPSLRARAARRQPQAPQAFQEGQKKQSGNGVAAAGLTASPDHLRATKMVNVCLQYFDELMSKGNAEVCHTILAPRVQHKDMVRNEGRYGISDYQRFVQELRSAYPEIYVRPTQFGLVDSHTLFVSFEGRVKNDMPLFKGVDMFYFTDDGSKIREIEVYRSNWLGAQGHEERKKKADQQHGQRQHQAGAGRQPHLTT